MQHVVIVGGGTIGSFLAKRISLENVRVTMIDQNPLVLKSLQHQLDIAVYACSATNYKAVQQAGINNADLFVATTRHDETNLIACLLADTLNIKNKIAVTRYLGARGHTWVGLKQSGKIVNTSEAVCQHLMETISLTGIHEQTSFADGELMLIATRLGHHSPLIGKQASELMKINPNMSITHLVRNHHAITCKEDSVIKKNDHLYLVVLRKGLQQAHEVLGVKNINSRQAVIFGGNFLSEMVAETLSLHGFEVNLMVPGRHLVRVKDDLKNRKRVRVTTGEVTLDSFKEHRVGKNRLFLAVSGDDTVNLLACMLAKSMGASKTVAAIKSLELEDPALKSGTDACIFPHLSTARAIHSQLHKDDILDYHAITQTNLSVVKLKARPHSRVTQVPLKHIQLPEGTVVGAIINKGKATLPSPSHIIKSTEEVLLLAHSENMPETEALFFH